MYTAINTSEISTGQPVSTDTQTKIKENFADHETRLTSLETSLGTTYPCITMRVGGYTNAAFNGVLKTTVNFAIKVTGIRILVDKAGSAGTIEVDIKKKSGGGAYTSLLTSLPSVGFAAGDDALSSNAILDAAHTTLAAGDILRLDLTSVQTNGKSFVVRIDYEKV